MIWLYIDYDYFPCNLSLITSLNLRLPLTSLKVIWHHKRYVCYIINYHRDMISWKFHTMHHYSCPDNQKCTSVYYILTFSMTLRFPILALKYSIVWKVFQLIISRWILILYIKSVYTIKYINMNLFKIFGKVVASTERTAETK